MATAQPAPADGQHDLTGTTVGRFAIRALLGAGGMGEVYRAEDTKLKRSVALKRVSQRLGSDQRSRQRILREAERASGLNSPHIASVYDVLEHDGEVFLVMEYVEGTTVRHRLRAGSLPMPEFFDVAVQCAEALDAAHRKGIVHRDIKPENIMLTAERQVKVLDFGLARRLPWADDTAITSSLESDTSFGGTPGYMAPEALVEQDLDARSDIFSLGVVFYEMATGRHPFRADKGAAARGPVALAPASQLVRQASADLDRVISKMLARDPEQRYATAADLLVDLRALERGGSLPSPAVEQPGRKWIRSALRVLAAVVIFAALLTAFPAVRQQWRQWFGGDGAVLPDKKHIAVLVFAPAADDPDARAFAQGLTETLTAKLTQLTDKYPLQVVPLSEIRGRQVASVQQARVGLGVNLVLEGSMRQVGGMVRVTYNLVDARTRRELRAGVVTAAAGDPFAVEDRVVASVVSALDLELAGQQRRALEARGTTQRDAYEHYLRGRGYLQDFREPGNIDRAVDAFSQAVALDRHYAPSYAGLGESYWYKYQSSREPAWVDTARQNCERASSLDAHLPAAYICLGTLHNGTGRFEQAAAAFQKALAQEPTNDDAYRGLARAYHSLGKLDAAERTYRQAIELRPHYWAGYSWLGALYFSQARYPEAVEQFQRWVTLARGSAEAHSSLGGTLIAMGRYDDAIASLKEAIQLRPTADAYSNLGVAYFNLRRFDEAVSVFERACNLGNSDYIACGNLARTYYWAPGQRARSRSAFEHAIRLGQERLKVNPRDADVHILLATYYAMLDKRNEAKEHLRQAFSLRSDDPEALFLAAIIYNQFGERPQALKLLAKSIARGYSRAEIKAAIELDDLRTDPRYQALIRTN